MDKDDVSEMSMGDSENKAATMRVQFIKLLIVNGLEIEIEVRFFTISGCVFILILGFVW